MSIFRVTFENAQAIIRADSTSEAIAKGAEMFGAPAAAVRAQIIG